MPAPVPQRPAPGSQRPALVSYPYGPWSNDNGTPTQVFNPDYSDPNYQRAEYVSFGPFPFQATVANSAAGTTSIPQAALMFDETPNVWVDSLQSAAVLSASMRANGYDFGYWA